MKISNPVGIRGEEISTNYLKDKGYKILERNYRKSYGEIDIIATKNNVLVFVEVKTRTSNQFGTPLEQITQKKLKTLTKTAQFYSQSHNELTNELRVDAISVLLDNSNNLVNIEHVENISS